MDPNVQEAQAVNSDASSEFATEKFNPLVKDFISKLPGVTSKNIFHILRNVTDIPHLLEMTLTELNDLLENSKEAKLLYEVLHDELKEPSQDMVNKRTGKQRLKFGKKPLNSKRLR